MDLVYYLRDAAPDLADLLLMEAEEVGGILLAACHRSGHAQFSRHNLLLNVQSNTPPIFDDDTARHLPAVLAEGWAWLERECLLIAKPNDPNWQFLSRKAQRIKSPAEFEVYRGAAAFPRALLHPRIEKEAWPSFSRGRFDTALFEAFREVEIAIRDAAGFAQHEHGVPMVRRAFHKETGPLTDHSVDDGEREATSNLFAGAIGSYKNPNSHRHVGREDVAEAGELMLLASHLLRVIEQRDQRWPANRLSALGRRTSPSRI